jgi:hypothetical protein
MECLALPSPASLLSEAKLELLEKIGATGDQQRILAAIVDYSLARYRLMCRLAAKLESGPAQLVPMHFLPTRVLERIKVSRQTGCWECEYYNLNGYARVYDEVSTDSGKFGSQVCV